LSHTAVPALSAPWSAINLRGTVMACKHVLPIMRQQRTGAIINISSTAAWEDYPLVTYKATKAATIAYTKQVAMQNAEYGVRANVILPGMMDTPMAVDTRARVSGKSRAEVAAMRDAKVPLRHRMGRHRIGRRQCRTVPRLAPTSQLGATPMPPKELRQLDVRFRELQRWPATTRMGAERTGTFWPRAAGPLWNEKTRIADIWLRNRLRGKKPSKSEEKVEPDRCF
jgi:hypothetical protein